MTALEIYSETKWNFEVHKYVVIVQRMLLHNFILLLLHDILVLNYLYKGCYWKFLLIWVLLYLEVMKLMPMPILLR